MKKNSFVKKFGILLFIFSLQVFPETFYAFAESFYSDSVQVSLPYKHIYTTNNTNTDSLFHFVIYAKDGAPLPFESDSNGYFSINGKSKNEKSISGKSVFYTDGNLSFEFKKPGVFCYEIKSDLVTDNKKKNASSYKFSSETISVSFYVEGSDNGNLTLNMITAQNSKDEKIDEIIFNSEFSDCVSSDSSSTPVVSTPTFSTSTQNTPVSNFVSSSASNSKSFFKTGENSHKLFYIITLMLSLVTMILLYILPKRDN